MLPKKKKKKKKKKKTEFSTQLESTSVHLRCSSTSQRENTACVQAASGNSFSRPVAGIQGHDPTRSMTFLSSDTGGKRRNSPLLKKHAIQTKIEGQDRANDQVKSNADCLDGAERKRHECADSRKDEWPVGSESNADSHVCTIANKRGWLQASER